MSDFQSRLQHALDADFLIERELSGAGMSRVFVATERALQRKVVIKVLPPELAAGVNVERFRREIQLAAQLQHPHIVPLLSAGDDDGLLWFTMPYIEGESLRGALERQKRLPSRDVVRILHDVVDALAYAHARGIVHRDIKPENILTQGMHALVTDFGVAKAISAAIPQHGGTTTGMAIGTPAYMAPEQLAADPAADHRVDIYGVGLLAYELLTGTSPFSGSSPQATLAAQLTRMPEPPHRTLSDIPEALSALIMHCLQKDADKRPQTAKALLAEIEALPTMPGGSTGARSGNRRVLLGVGLVSLAILAPVAVSYLRTASSKASNQTASSRPDSAGTIASPNTAASHQASPAFREINDAPESTVVPLVITRAESLAIADAVRKRQVAEAALHSTGAAATAASAKSAATPSMSAPGSKIMIQNQDGSTASVDRDMLLAEMGRIFADSMNRALKHMDSALAADAPRRQPIEPIRTAPGPGPSFTPMLAPPTDARLRIVVSDYSIRSDNPGFQRMASGLSSSLRRAISSDRFDVVGSDITERALQTAPNRMALGWTLRADYVVSGTITPRGDSVAIVTMFTDVRTGRFSRVVETVTPMQDVRRSFTPVQQKVIAWLDTAASMPVRRGGSRESVNRQWESIR